MSWTDESVVESFDYLAQIFGNQGDVPLDEAKELWDTVFHQDVMKYQGDKTWNSDQLFEWNVRQKREGFKPKVFRYKKKDASSQVTTLCSPFLCAYFSSYMMYSGFWFFLV